jgi:hypothetical protein
MILLIKKLFLLTFAGAWISFVPSDSRLHIRLSQLASRLCLGSPPSTEANKPPKHLADVVPESVLVLLRHVITWFSCIVQYTSTPKHSLVNMISESRQILNKKQKQV